MVGPRAGFGNRPGLDGLRAVAVLAVLAFHTGALSAGWIGVDLFFCLSGYLITGLLIAEGEHSGRIALVEFWRRRARRLIPAVVLLLALVVVVGWIPVDGWTVPSRADVWGALTYTSNWTHLAADHGYFEQFSAPSPLEHMWSLAVEEQFYVVWPLLFAAAWHVCRRRGVVVLAASVAALTAAWQVVLGLGTDAFDRVYLGTDTRAPAFALGALAVAIADRGGAPLRAARFVAPVGVLGLVVASVVLDGDARWTYTGGLLAASAIGVLTVWSVARLDPASLAGRVLSWRPARLVGRWSYGVYLFHWPVALLIGRRRFAPPLQFAIVTAVSVAVAALSYELVEHRIRRSGVPRRLLAPAVACVAVVAAVAVVVAATPRPALTAEETEALLAPITMPLGEEPDATFASTSTPTAGETTTPVGSGPVEATVANALTVPIGDRRLLVIGDSVPYLLVDEWAEVGAAEGTSVVVRAAVGCRQSADERDQGRTDTAAVCAAMVANLSRDLQQFRPAALLYHYGMADQYVRDGGVTYSSCSAEGRAALTQQVGAMVAAAGATGTMVFLVMPNDPPDELGLDPGGERFAGADCYRETYLALAASNRATVRLLRLDELVCPAPDSGCEQSDELRYDGIHFTDEGTAIVLPWLLERMFATA